jgi:hypothetical protein
VSKKQHMQLGHVTKGTLLGTMHVKSWITPCGLLSTQRTFLFRDRLIYPHLTSEEQIHARLVPPASSTPPRFRPLTANKLNFQAADFCACCTTCDTTPDAASHQFTHWVQGSKLHMYEICERNERVPLHFLQFLSRLTPRSAFHNSTSRVMTTLPERAKSTARHAYSTCKMRHPERPKNVR